jgi:multidrug resistance efflux pump
MLLPLALVALAAQVHSQSTAVNERMVLVDDGLVTLIDEVSVPATQMGMLMGIHVKEGQSIDNEALLADIDSRETKAKKRIAEGELTAAFKQAENLAEIKLAEKGVDVAKAEYDSWNEIRLKTPGAVSQTDLRKYQFQYERALAQQEVAINENLIAQVTTEVKQAQLDAADIELTLRQIRSPFKGQVIEIFKKRGEWVQAGEAIMHVAGLEKLRVKGTVSAELASPIEVIGKPVTITIEGAGKKTHTVKATIGFASPIIDLGVFRVWADVNNEPFVDPVTKQESWKIEPGATATMKIDLTPPPPPKAAVPTKTEPGKGGASKGGALPPGKATSKQPVSGAVESFRPIVPTSPGDKSQGSAKEKSAETGKVQATKSDGAKAEPIRAEPAKVPQTTDKKLDSNTGSTPKER